MSATYVLEILDKQAKIDMCVNSFSLCYQIQCIVYVPPANIVPNRSNMMSQIT